MINAQNTITFILRFCLLVCLNASSQAIDHVKANVHPQNYSQDTKLAPTILHILYTGESLEDSLKTFANPKEGVSVHYLIAEDGKIYSLVSEDYCAWHAGKSHWGSVDSVNKHSIGVALVNIGITDDAAKTQGWKAEFPSYPKKQIQALVLLARELVHKHKIKPWNVVGHSDVAPDRKYDPGLSFPWKALADEGIGLWPNEEPVSKDIVVSEREFLKNLAVYGYGVAEVNADDAKKAISAFQAHFRPSRVDGIVDADTYAILQSLLEKRKVLI